MKTLTISSARHKALLASSVRQDLLDTLGAAGPATARELAPQLGMRVSALYYHLQLLERAALITRTVSIRGSGARGVGTLRKPLVGSSRRDEAVYAVRAPRLVVEHDTRSAAGRRASQRIARALLRAAERDFATTLRSSGDRPWLSRVKGWLTTRQIAEVRAHLQAIDDLVLRSRRGRGKTLCAVSSVIATLDRDAVR